MAKLKCPAVCCSEDTEHKFLEERGDYNQTYFVECSCGFQREVSRKEWLFAENIKDWTPSNARAYLTKFPYVEPHSGMVVTSKEHRDEVMKKMGFHKAEHGVNEKYHDETAELMRRKRQDLAERRRAMDERRRSAGVAPRRSR